MTTKTRDFAWSEYVVDGSKCPASHAFGVESDDDLEVRFGDRSEEKTGLLRVLAEYDDNVSGLEEYDPQFVPDDIAKAAWMDAIEEVDGTGFDTSLAVEAAEKLGWTDGE